MPKPKENQNKKGTVGGKRMAKRGPSSVTKKKDRLKRSLDRESSQLTISQVEKPEKVDEEKVRKEMEEREEARRIWLQQQRIKYPVAPDGFIPNSIVRSNLQPHVPHPPEKQPEEKTKQLTFLERRMSRLERMNSIDIQLQQQFGPSSEMRFTDSISQSSSTSLNAVDRDRPSSKKKQRGSDVVNDVVTQIRNTSPQLLTSLLELEDIAEVESRLESTPHGSTREREMDGGNGGEEMEGRRGMEDKRGGEEDGGKKKMESRRSGRDLPHHLDHNHHSSVAKQQTIDDDHQTSATIQHTHGNEGDSDSSDPNRRREDKGLEKIKELKEDGDGDDDAISAAAAADAREGAGKEERDVKVGDDGEDLEKYPPSSWKIPLIVEPGDDENDAEEETTREGEGGEGEGGDGRGGGSGGGELESDEVDLTKGKDGAAVAEHDGNFGANHVTGSGSDGASHSDENEKPSQEVEIENGEGGQASNRGQRVDSKTEKETETEENVVKVVDICLPFLRQLDEGDSAAGEATTNAANDDDAAGEEPEADEDESGENSRRRRRRRRRRRIDGEEEWEALSPSYSSFALRPPRLHDDDLDLTSFNSSMAATNASPPTFIEMDDSQTGAKDDGEINFLDSRKDFPFAMGDYNDERERNDDELVQLNGGDGQQHQQHQQLRGDGVGVDENDRFWSSCSNGRLNRRHQHRDSMDDVLNPSPPLGWHLTWYDRHHQGQQHLHSGSSKADDRKGGGGGGGDADGFLPRLLQLASSSSKDDRKGRRHRCEYSILVQKRMHEHISISRYLRTKKLAEILCDFRRPINYNVIKFQYAV